MAKRERETVETVAREFPVCPECDRTFKERDMVTLAAEPEITIATDEFQIYATRDYYDSTNTYYTEALELETRWSCLICKYCIKNKYDISIPARPESKAREDVNQTVLTDGGVINEYREEYYTEKQSETNIHCDKCEQTCDNSHLEFHLKPEIGIHNSELGSFGKFYINENCHTEYDASWQDATYIESKAIIHLCNTCNTHLRPTTAQNLRQRLSSWIPKL